MALKREKQPVQHVLFTDVPGEWYARWAFDADAAPGVSWIVQHADSFLLFADSNALAGPRRGEARARYDALARRVAAVARGRAVLPVRSKADLEISGDISRFIDDLNHELFAAATLPISAIEDNGTSLAGALGNATGAGVSWSREPTLPASDQEGDVLFAYRDRALTQ
jgi:hypothetical protein